MYLKVKSNDLWPIIAAKLGFPLAPPGQHPEPRADAKVGGTSKGDI